MEVLQLTKGDSTISEPSIIGCFKELPNNLDENTQKQLESCIQILQKSPNARNQEDEETFASIIRGFNFLKGAIQEQGKFSNGLQKLAKLAKYEFFSAGSTVMHKDDIGDRVYFVMKGAAVAYNEIITEYFNNNIEDLSSPKANEDDTTAGQVGFHLADDQEGTHRRPRPNLFQPKKNMREIHKLTYQPSMKSANKKLTRDSPPEAIWDVDKALSHIMNDKDEFFSSENMDNNEKDYREMLLEYKLLETIAGERPGRYLKEGHFFYRPCKKIEAGSYFGELALITNKPRSATIVASQDLHCFSFNKRTFDLISNRRIENMNPSMKFLEEYFPEATKSHLARLAYLVEEHHYPYNHVIYWEKDAPDALYFIKTGEIQLVKKFSLAVGEDVLLKSQGGLFGADKKMRSIITTLCQGETLGEDEIFNESEREYTAVVGSRDAVVLKLSKKIYDNLNDDYKALFSNIEKLTKNKKFFRKQKADQVEILNKNNLENSQHIKNIVQEQKEAKNSLLKSYRATSKWIKTESIENNTVESLPKLSSPLNNENLSKHNTTTPTIMHMIPPDRLIGGSKEFLTRSYFEEEEDRSSKLDTSGLPTSRSPQRHQSHLKSTFIKLKNIAKLTRIEQSPPATSKVHPDSERHNTQTPYLQQQQSDSLQRFDTENQTLKELSVTGFTSYSNYFPTRSKVETPTQPAAYKTKGVLGQGVKTAVRPPTSAGCRPDPSEGSRTELKVATQIRSSQKKISGFYIQPGMKKEDRPEDNHSRSCKKMNTYVFPVSEKRHSQLLTSSIEESHYNEKKVYSEFSTSPERKMLRNSVLASNNDSIFSRVSPSSPKKRMTDFIKVAGTQIESHRASFKQRPEITPKANLTERLFESEEREMRSSTFIGRSLSPNEDANTKRGGRVLKQANKTDREGFNGKMKNIHLDETPNEPSEDGLLKDIRGNSKKKTITASTHSMFRLKPERNFLRQRYEKVKNSERNEKVFNLENILVKKIRMGALSKLAN